ncbi:hypothetical protein [Mesorhizobium sp.]|uniref:hypothetical protein n=1 Tax=Mesorhizobium sp. TaxID=1871066 RepID=UPI000FE989EC|nr:hypothetical protein [Mesorhizobium sp.]RWN54135.1 MAG: hypothetical protein EOS00_29050 [Mesorhizobium sp.]
MEFESDETDAMRDHRRGRTLSEMPPEDRLQYANLKVATAVPADEETDSVQAEEHNAVQAEYLRNLRKDSVADLNEEQREMFDYMGERFTKKPDSDSGSTPPASLPPAPPFELDLDTVNREGALRRLGIWDDFNMVARVRAQTGMHPSLRTVSEHELAQAELRVKPYLRKK